MCVATSVPTWVKNCKTFSSSYRKPLHEPAEPTDCSSLLPPRADYSKCCLRVHCSGQPPYHATHSWSALGFSQSSQTPQARVAPTKRDKNRLDFQAGRTLDRACKKYKERERGRHQACRYVMSSRTQVAAGGANNAMHPPLFPLQHAVRSPAWSHLCLPFSPQTEHISLTKVGVCVCVCVCTSIYSTVCLPASVPLQTDYLFILLQQRRKKLPE